MSDADDGSSSAPASTRLRGVLFRRTLRGGHASLAIVVTDPRDADAALPPAPPEERMVLVVVRLGGPAWGDRGADGPGDAAALRSRVRRLCKLGNELEFYGRFDGAPPRDGAAAAPSNGAAAEAAPPSTDWRAWETFAVDYYLPAEGEEGSVRVRRELAWDAARCQRTRARYFAAPVAAQPAKNGAGSSERPRIKADTSKTRHHGGGIGKRRQGEIVADFLLWMLSAPERDGDEPVPGTEELTNDLADGADGRRRPFAERWAPLPPSVAARAARTVQARDERGPAPPPADDHLRPPPCLAGGVVDAAGGAGHVSLALALRGVRSTVVDPRAAAGRLPGRDRRALRRSGAQPFAAYRAWFGGRPAGVDGRFREGAVDAGREGASAAEETAVEDPSTADGTPVIDPTSLPVCSICSEDRLLADCAALVALHPDEATGAVVDAAVAGGIPFLAVPCCVFSRLFPERRTPGGAPVGTYEDLLDWLVAKDPAIRVTRLPFEGANLAVWATFDGGAGGGRGRGVRGSDGQCHVEVAPGV